MNISVFVFILVLVTPTHAMHKDGLPAAASTGFSAVILTKDGACALKAHKPTVATAPTEQEFYESRLNAWQTSLPTVLSHLIARYCMAYVIKDKDDFGRCISECSDGSFELEAIKEYIDRDPTEHIALRFYLGGYTPLMLARNPKPETEEARPGLMRLLLSYPQDLNTQHKMQNRYETALHMATGARVPIEHLILLVEYGADFYASSRYYGKIKLSDGTCIKSPFNAEQWASRHPDHIKPYMFLKCAREFDEQLQQTMPDLLPRRKIVANQLRMLCSIIDLANLTQAETNAEAQADQNFASWYTTDWFKGVMEQIWEVLTHTQLPTDENQGAKK